MLGLQELIVGIHQKELTKKELTTENAIVIIGTCARLTYFYENEEDYKWGIGSSFLINY